jgi:glycosyltransferase involved in cell wall biosynthesis
VFSEFDVMHFHGPWEPSNVQFARVCRFIGKPYVISTHGMLDDWSMAHHRLQKSLHLALLGRPMLHGAHAVHCTARAELDQSSRWFPRARTMIAPLVVDLAPFGALPGPGSADRAFGLPQDGRARLVFLGRLHPKKGVEVLLGAAALLSKRGPCPLVLLAGTGEPAYRRVLESMLEQENLQGTVRFLGQVSGVEKISLLEGADLMVLPTSQENFGLALVEALAAGTPVLTTKGVDIWPELLKSGGARIADRTPEAFEAAIQDLLADRERLSEMGRKGRAFTLDWLSPAGTLARFVDCYSEAVHRGRNRGG